MEALRSRREQPGTWTFGEVQQQLDTNEVIDLSNEPPPTGDDLAHDNGDSVNARSFQDNPSGPWAVEEDELPSQGVPQVLGPSGGGASSSQPALGACRHGGGDD